MACKRNAAAGVDGQTWASYGEGLQARLADLSDRLARGGYRPQPVRRVYIGKTDGSKRPLGVPALEDKIVQRATVEVLNAIYERDFRGFSYGFILICVQRYRSDPLETGHRLGSFGVGFEGTNASGERVLDRVQVGEDVVGEAVFAQRVP